MRTLASPMLLVLASGLAFAQSSGAGKATPRPGGLSGVGQLSTEFAAAANARDAARVAALYAEDAVLMPPNGEAVHGRAAIQAFWQGMLDQGARDVSVTATGSSVSGSVGYEAGTYQFTMQPAGGQAAQDRGKYLVGLKRGSDGKWRFTHDIFNSDLPCPPPPAK